MRSNSNVEEKMGKTGALLGLANIVMSPLLFSDSRAGLVVMVALNGFLLSHLHGLGKRRRPGSNALSAVHSIFVDPTDREVIETDNTIRNIINGGAAMFDSLANRFCR
tara:strand:+ start:544 stop:867 length:324 start_codon:yes stop_codon:yes gene_type:complete